MKKDWTTDEEKEPALGSVATRGCYVATLASLPLNLNMYGYKVADKYSFGSCKGFWNQRWKGQFLGFVLPMSMAHNDIKEQLA